MFTSKLYKKTIRLNWFIERVNYLIIISYASVDVLLRRIDISRKDYVCIFNRNVTSTRALDIITQYLG